MKSRDVNYMRKIRLVCSSIRTTTTFTMEAWCSEWFFKVCCKAPYAPYRLNNYKRKQRVFREGNQKIPQKLFQGHYCLDCHLEIDDWDFILFKQCETYKQLTGRNLLEAT